ncbi:hypothetical protein GS942_16795 [Rhodococcus hoagii]|nr:hypothetical protein [Prescottella equi]NKW33719.1 hypothetical protein [Prescottella equi]
MAVSKRLRYEILRRDNHACRYCGGAAPDVKLTVDHVVPTTLGGSDQPSNLVAACADCNSGKSATPPDAAIVADVEKDAIRWATAMRRAAELERQKRANDDEFAGAFFQNMVAAFNEDRSRFELPALDPGGTEAMATTIVQFRDVGLDLADLDFAIRKAMSNQRLSEDDIWRYFCGIAWRMVEDRQRVARSLLQEADDGA